MSEVDGPKISVNQANINSIRKQSISQEPEQNGTEQQQITSFSNDQAETIGRSMLFKGADNTNNDLKAIIENPQIAKNSDEIFEAAYTEALKAGVANPYEEAASVSTTSF
ncbi:MAG: hypothetical protein MJ230_06020 [bacterium]|nr:hypothetical protein [bacterium]